MNHWFSDDRIEIVEICGKWYALNGWNGEVYTDCWETEEPSYGTSCECLAEGILIQPLYEPYPDNPEQYQCIGYSVV